MMTRFKTWAPVVALSLGTLGCDGGGTANLEILLTDAPIDYIDSAVIQVTSAYLQGGADDEAGEEGAEAASGRVMLFEASEEPREFDLLTLQDGVTASLSGMETIPAGTYGQLRVVVSEATVTLKDGYTFPGDETTATLQVPSGSSSGIKVQLNRALLAEDGTTTTLTLDVPLDENFVLQGGEPGPDGVIDGILFTPLIRELSRDGEG